MTATTSAAADRTTWIEQFFRAVDAHEFERVEGDLTAGCVIDAPGFRHSGGEVVVLWMAGFFAAFPDLRHRPHRVVAGDDQAAILV